MEISDDFITAKIRSFSCNGYDFSATTSLFSSIFWLACLTCSSLILTFCVLSAISAATLSRSIALLASPDSRLAMAEHRLRAASSTIPSEQAS